MDFQVFYYFARYRVLGTAQQLSVYYDVHISMLTPQKPPCRSSQLCDLTVTGTWVNPYKSFSCFSGRPTAQFSVYLEVKEHRLQNA